MIYTHILKCLLISRIWVRIDYAVRDDRTCRQSCRLKKHIFLFKLKLSGFVFHLHFIFFFMKKKIPRLRNPILGRFFADGQFFLLFYYFDFIPNAYPERKENIYIYICRVLNFRL